MELGPGRWFSGPMYVVTWLVALGWLVLGVLSLVGLPWPGGVVLGVVGVAGGLITGWLAFSLRIPYDDRGITLPQHGRVSWDDVHAVQLQPGLLTMPYLVVRRGRALDEVPLDGLAWFGGPDGRAHSLAEKVAVAADVDIVTVRKPRGGVGRRAA